MKDKDEVARLVELLKKININIELASNYPWIYIKSICGQTVTEKLDSEHGFVIGYFNRNDGTQLNDISEIHKLIRKYTKKKKPFTKVEQEIMDLLVEAHNKFVELKPTHPSDITEWVNGIHRCQKTLMARVVRRDYPNEFY